MSSDTDSSTEEIKDDERWADGDFEIVTADNVRFRAPSFYLFAHSIVLRDLYNLDPSKEKKICFCDTTFETAEVLLWFLELAITSSVDVQPHWRPRLSIVKFLHEWDCQSLKETYLLFLRDGLITGSSRPLSSFVAGAELGCLKTCARALDRPACKWTEQHAQTDKTCVLGLNNLNLTGWPLAIFQNAPQTYGWALGRAFQERDALAKQGYPDPGLSQPFLKYFRVTESGTE